MNPSFRAKSVWTEWADTHSKEIEACAGRPRANFVRMFKQRFAALVESGAKTQTVRPTPKRMLRPGDTISLRCWTGAPYRSKQRVLREALVESVLPFDILECGQLMLDDIYLTSRGMDDFARADGFSTLDEMLAWFREAHGLPFHGIVIFWHTGENALPEHCDPAAAATDMSTKDGAASGLALETDYVSGVLTRAGTGRIKIATVSPNARTSATPETNL